MNTNNKNNRHFLSFLFSKKYSEPPIENERKYYPEKKTNWISQMTFWWLNPLFNTGYKRNLVKEDLYKLTDDITVETMANKFEYYFKKKIMNDKINYLKRIKKLKTQDKSDKEFLRDYKAKRTIIIFALLSVFKWQFISSCIYLSINNCLTVFNSLVLRELVNSLSDSNTNNTAKKICLGVCMALFVLFSSLCMNQFFYKSMLTGIQVKAILTKIIYEKSFKIDNKYKKDFSDAKIMSLVGTDLSRIDLAIGFQPFFIVFPVPFIISIIILINNIGVSALVGILILIVSMIIITLLTNNLYKLRKKADFYTDSRIECIKEVLNGLKILKYYCWENSIYDKISKLRKKELNYIKKMQILKNSIISFTMSLTLIISMCSVLVLIILDKNLLTSSRIFSSISLFSLMTQQIIMIPISLATGIDALLGLFRVGSFLTLDIKLIIDESSHDKNLTINDVLSNLNNQNMNFLNKLSIESKTDSSKDLKNYLDLNEMNNTHNDSEIAIEAVNVSVKISNNFFLQNENKKDIDNKSDISSLVLTKRSSIVTNVDQSKKKKDFKGLFNFSFEIKKNEFIILAGATGCGKSFFLNTLARRLKLSKGLLEVNDSLILCSIPWIHHGTIRDNILFGSEFNYNKYKNVIYICSLVNDFKSLIHGDLTITGENGASLSGGQKTRISLARSIYSDRNIILMDDVLSAIDSRVGDFIFNKCILDFLKNKTRILATHQISLFQYADRIIFLDENGTLEIDTVKNLRKKNKNFNNLMINENQKNTKDVETDTSLSFDTSLKKDLKKIIEENNYESHDLNINETQFISESLDLEKGESNTNTADENEVEIKVSKKKIFYSYLKFGCGSYFIIILMLFLILNVTATFLQIFSNVWLSYFAKNQFNQTEYFYKKFYVLFVMLSFVFLTSEFIALASINSKSSLNISLKSMKMVLHTKMSWIDSTPNGKILSKFTKDTEVLDNEMNDQIRLIIFMTSNIIGVFILSVIYLRWFLILIPVVVFFFAFLIEYYLATTKVLKKIESQSKIRLNNNINESLDGMEIIKIYDSVNRFFNLNNKLINKMCEGSYLIIGSQRWLGVRTDCISVTIVLFVSILCGIKIFNISDSSTGLLISYTLQITSQISLLVRTYTLLQNQFSSLTKVYDFAVNLPQEDLTDTKFTLLKSWPLKVNIVFENVDFAYRKDLPLVLKNLCFKINHAEKIGICGRTGSGKSSLLYALFRLTELRSGKIIIDDIDIKNVSLYDLRSRITIIPQESIMFKGTIRSNLDPFNVYSDDELWNSLVKTGLINSDKLEIVKNQTISNDKDETAHKFHLYNYVENNGDNYSLGEKQLISITRALIKKKKILVLDEATSSIDYSSDLLIQNTIKNEFNDCTVLCIAHRLKTIINYDKIIVLNQGQIEQFDTPQNLFNSEGIFKTMCEKAKITKSDFNM